MTLAELERAFKSAQRRIKREAQEKANYDYILADLIGRSISRIYSSSARMPGIEEIYPNLFESKEIQEKKQEQLAELSALRFRQFAEAYNRKFKEVGEEN